MGKCGIIRIEKIRRTAIGSITASVGYRMSYKKCSVCDINWIDESAEICAVCAEERGHSTGSRYGANKKGNPPNRDKELTVTIVQALGVARGKVGYLAYDKNNRNIGVVFMSDDKRTTRYGNSELSFYEKDESELGSWRTIKMNGGYFPFEKLKEILSRQGKYVCTTDAR